MKNVNKTADLICKLEKAAIALSYIGDFETEEEIADFQNKESGFKDAAATLYEYATGNNLAALDDYLSYDMVAHGVSPDTDPLVMQMAALMQLMDETHGLTVTPAYTELVDQLHRTVAGVPTDWDYYRSIYSAEQPNAVDFSNL